MGSKLRKRGWWQPALTFSFFILELAFLSGCRGAQSALDPAGPQAARIGRLWWLMFYVCSAVFLAVSIALLIAIFRERKGREKKKGDEPDTSPEPKRERLMTRIVAGAVGLTVVILFVFLITDFFTGRALYSHADPQALTIKITGQQWWWDVEYETEPASSIVHTANEIHIPTGQLVKFRLTSTDVIHSFWVPNLNGKKDLIPGHEITLTFQADRAGEYRGQCAEFCGYQHAHMAFTVVAEAPEKFYEWMNRQRAPSVEPTNDAERRGQQVFLSSPCIMCHSIRGTIAGGRIAPDLTHLASRKSIAAGTLPNTRGHLAGWITNSQEIKPGNHMPPVPLGPEDLQALLAYLESLK
ncbi:MAG TPA: cytochrome c oxidase subunit II [Pyrinomonadaceae bacterium]|nr:cytochrome c oxidase subunit II [Pyrinomonadaceae bacterium]